MLSADPPLFKTFILYSSGKSPHLAWSGVIETVVSCAAKAETASETVMRMRSGIKIFLAPKELDNDKPICP
jgi:hypothetical protein